MISDDLGTEAIGRALRAHIREALKEGVVKIDFNKVDGTKRKMICTLQESYLPEPSSTTTTNRPDNPNILHVWDIENDGWRSIRVDSIIDIDYDYSE